MSRTTWIVWGAALLAAVLCAALLPFAHTMTFLIAAVGLLMSFALSAVALRRGKEAKSDLMGMPLWQMAVGTLFIQLIAAFLLMYFAGSCSWLIAVVVEGLILCVDAAALTEWKEPEEQPEAKQDEGGPTDG